MVERHIQIQPEVAEALANGRPVVALESTLITHGLPYPLNRDTAAAMEDEVRSVGAVPATIAVLDGQIRVGLPRSDLDELVSRTDALKISSRGLPYVVASGCTAGTTVSGTMWIAAKSGIQYFATGGIGGVHHGATDTGDVSSDLTELSRTPVAVVCSGVKSILDIGRTLEYLETVGVPVYGYQTDEFPAFFSGISGYPVPYRIDDASHTARIWQKHRELGIESGAVIACPPPITADDATALRNSIGQANREAVELEIRGGDVTPFVLRRISEISGGASLRVNTALLRHNARIAAEIAVAAINSDENSGWNDRGMG